MKYHNLTFFGFALGLFVIIISTIRWFFLMPDYSNFVFGVGIGVVICGGSYLYNWIRDVDKRFMDANNRIDAMFKWFSKMEWGDKNE